ncbi:MAG: dihydropteroate synthase [Bacteroidetes bacterium]|nr:dihydropteroate synthase [Bacteroidota bacterium]
MFPKIMAVINVTPDSFSDGNGKLDLNEKISFAEQMINDGADIIDIGGETTKPYSKSTPANIELDRVLPVLKQIKNKYPNFPVSIDTRKVEVANECLKHNANIINDVSGLQYNPEIAEIVAKYNAKLVIMHSKGNPQNMQNNPFYKDVVEEVFNFLKEKISFAKSKGVEKIIGDIGIGFGKTLEHNLALLKNINRFSLLDVPMLLGISRKRFIGEITEIETPSDRDFATMIYHSLLLKEQSISIIRVHNVRLAMQMKKIYLSGI